MNRTIPEAEAILEILAADGVVRSRLIGDFVAGKRADIRRVAYRLCHDFRLDWRRHMDEVASMLDAECLTMIQEIIEHPSKLDYVTGWTGLLYRRARNEVRSYAHGGASGENLSGMDAVLRRRNELAKTRAALRADLNGEPTDQQVVEETNRRMLRPRKDAARQSMICSVDDLKPSGFVPLLDDDHDVPVEDPSGDLMPHEARELIRLIRKAVAGDPVMAAVCDAWIGGVYDETVGAPRDVNEIARLVHMPVAQVAEVLADLQNAAQQIATDEFGIARDEPQQEAS